MNYYHILYTKLLGNNKIGQAVLIMYLTHAFYFFTYLMTPQKHVKTNITYLLDLC